MASKSYVPIHSLHKHYYVQGMARFKVSRMQYGKDLGSILKRMALPLVKRGKNSSTTCAEGCHGYRKKACGAVTGWLCNDTHAKTEKTKRYKEKNYNKGDHFNEKAQTRHIRHILVFSTKK